LIGDLRREFARLRRVANCGPNLFESESPDGMPTAALTRTRGVVPISEINLEEEIRTTEGWVRMANSIATALREDGIELPADITANELRRRLDNERRYQAMVSEGLPALYHTRHCCGHSVYWDTPGAAVLSADLPCPWCMGASPRCVVCDPRLGTCRQDPEAVGSEAAIGSAVLIRHMADESCCAARTASR